MLISTERNLSLFLIIRISQHLIAKILTTEGFKLFQHLPLVTLVFYEFTLEGIDEEFNEVVELCIEAAYLIFLLFFEKLMVNGDALGLASEQNILLSMNLLIFSVRI